MNNGRPGHFHANERFHVDVAFEADLPEGALPLAELAGPIGPGGPALTFWTSSVADVDGSSRRSVRLYGKIPADAPPGQYRISQIEVRWSADMPLSWEPVTVPIGHLGDDVAIYVDVAAPRSQPVIPRVVAAG